MIKKVILAIVLLAVSLSSWSSELYTGQAVMHNDSDEIMATVKFDTPETGDMYVATIKFMLQYLTVQSISIY